jgi:hypothetical protein
MDNEVLSPLEILHKAIQDAEVQEKLDEINAEHAKLTEASLAELKAKRNKLNHAIEAIERQQMLDRARKIDATEQKQIRIKLEELENIKEEYAKAKENGKARRAHEDEMSGQAALRRSQEEAERKRKTSLTRLQKIEDEIIDYRRMIDMERGCYTNYKRPGENDIISW